MKYQLSMALCLTAAAPLASAQGSVTVYGLMDVGVTAMSNDAGKRTLIADDGVLSPNLFGIRGIEDLGNGMKAVFKIESQFSVYDGAFNGSTDSEFGRQAYIGIEDRRWGTLTVGEQYGFMFTSLSASRLGEQLDYQELANFRQGPFNALGKPNLPSGDFDFDGTAGSQRVDNAVRYQAPTVNGLTFGAMYGFGNQAGGFGTDSEYSAGIDYSPGPFSIDAAYSMVKYSSINNGRDGIRNFGAGGRMNIGHGAFDVLYTNTQNTFTGAEINVVEVGGFYPLAQRLKVIASYDYMSGNHVLQGNRASQCNLTVDYALSKRTDIYVSGEYQHASGDDGQATAWILVTNGASSSENQTVLRLGMRHAF